MDSASNLRSVHGLVAFVRCLVLALADASDDALGDVFPKDLPFWIEKQNRFRAGQLGLDAEYIIDAKGEHRPMRGFIRDLLDFCRPIAPRIDEIDGLGIAEELLDEVPGYRLQLDAYEAQNSARSVVELLQQGLVDGLHPSATDHECSRRIKQQG